jgi:hypothetical protein
VLSTDCRRILVDRDILSDSHRTNKVTKKLTVVSVVFLPLTFLVGVYGMNFEILPELKWRYGYGCFWALVALTVVGLVALLRRSRLLQAPVLGRSTRSRVTSLPSTEGGECRAREGTSTPQEGRAGTEARVHRRRRERLNLARR